MSIAVKDRKRQLAAVKPKRKKLVPQPELKRIRKIHVRLRYSPRAWQEVCQRLINSYRFVVFAVHRRAGKTELAIAKLINSAIAAKLELSMFVYIAPFLAQAETVVWERLKHELADFIDQRLVKVSEKKLSIYFYKNGCTLRLFGGDRPDALRGIRLDGAVIDEVAQIKPIVWEKIIQPALSDRLGWAMFIGTSNGVNLFSELFYKNETDWHSKKFNVYETNALPAEEVARLKRDMSSQAFAREYMCDFEVAGDDQLISVEASIAASKRSHDLVDLSQYSRIFGVDVARYGNDSSVIAIRQGLKLVSTHKYKQLDNVTFANKIADMIRLHKPEQVFIDAGGGAGVIDVLRSLNHDVVEVHFAASADNVELYQNKRAEMYFRLKEWIEKKGDIPENQDLIKEISTPRYFYNQHNKRQLEKKEDIKARLQNASPDLADALALTFCFNDDFRAKLHKLYNEQNRVKSLEHDPYIAV